MNSAFASSSTHADDLTALWQQVAVMLRQRIGADTFARWFPTARLLEVSENTAILGVSNAIYQYFIEDNYLQPLHESVTITLGRPITLRIREATAEESQAHTAAQALNGAAHKQEAPHSAVEEVANPAETALAEALKVGRNLPPASGPTLSAEEAANRTGLVSKYTFDAYVVGTHNQHAHAAAAAVGSSPGKTYNPLFIHGGVGLGKTHLLHAIGHEILRRKRTANVRYTTSEQFTNEFVQAIENKTLIKFRKRYRQLDVLMIDDIQFLGGKDRTQEEFFHTFNSLFDGHKQIILASDRPASEIASLQDRLVSRFDWGMSAALMSPDEETRIAILRKKINSMPGATQLTDDVVNFMAANIKTNVRRLEGALTRVASYASLMSSSAVTIEVIRPLIKDLLQEERGRGTNIANIQSLVAEVFDLRPSEMTSKRRSARVAGARQVAMFLSRKMTNNSLQEIGSAFGGRDHGTVLHAVKTVKTKMEADDQLRRTVDSIEEKLLNV